MIYYELMDVEELGSKIDIRTYIKTFLESPDEEVTGVIIERIYRSSNLQEFREQFGGDVHKFTDDDLVSIKELLINIHNYNKHGTSGNLYTKLKSVCSVCKFYPDLLPLYANRVFEKGIIDINPDKGTEKVSDFETFLDTFENNNNYEDLEEKQRLVILILKYRGMNDWDMKIDRNDPEYQECIDAITKEYERARGLVINLESALTSFLESNTDTNKLRSKKTKEPVISFDNGSLKKNPKRERFKYESQKAGKERRSLLGKLGTHYNDLKKYTERFSYTGFSEIEGFLFHIIEDDNNIRGLSRKYNRSGKIIKPDDQDKYNHMDESNLSNYDLEYKAKYLQLSNVLHKLKDIYLLQNKLLIDGVEEFFPLDELEALFKKILNNIFLIRQQIYGNKNTRLDNKDYDGIADNLWNEFYERNLIIKPYDIDTSKANAKTETEVLLKTDKPIFRPVFPTEYRNNEEIEIYTEPRETLRLALSGGNIRVIDSNINPEVIDRPYGYDWVLSEENKVIGLSPVDMYWKKSDKESDKESDNDVNQHQGDVTELINELSDIQTDKNIGPLKKKFLSGVFDLYGDFKVEVGRIANEEDIESKTQKSILEEKYIRKLGRLIKRFSQYKSPDLDYDAENPLQILDSESVFRIGEVEFYRKFDMTCYESALLGAGLGKLFTTEANPIYVSGFATDPIPNLNGKFKNSYKIDHAICYIPLADGRLIQYDFTPNITIQSSAIQLLDQMVNPLANKLAGFYTTEQPMNEGVSIQPEYKIDKTFLTKLIKHLKDNQNYDYDKLQELIIKGDNGELGSELSLVGLFSIYVEFENFQGDLQLFYNSVAKDPYLSPDDIHKIRNRILSVAAIIDYFKNQES